MLTSEDKILLETCGNLKDFLPEDCWKNLLTNWKRTEKEECRTNFLLKLPTTSLPEHMAGTVGCFCVFLKVLSGSVETYLRWRYIFCNSFVEYLFLFSKLQTLWKSRCTCLIIENKVAHFCCPQCTIKPYSVHGNVISSELLHLYNFGIMKGYISYVQHLRGQYL